MTTTAIRPDIKSGRLETRLDAPTAELLAAAASSEGMTMSAFVVNAARERAEKVLAWRGDVTMVSSETFTELMDALNRPAREIPELAALAKLPRVSARA